MSYSIPEPTEQPNIPYGYCHCGCGQKTKIIRLTSNEHGRVAGEPHRFVRGHNARGLCRAPIIDSQDRGWREILLTKGMVTIVDAADYEWLSSFNWQANKAYLGFYAMRKVWVGKTSTNVLMHRFIMGAESGQEIDHVNGNRLDNRRSNLRFATREQNARNRKTPSNNKSGYKGVRLERRKWRARIQFDGKQISLGNFETPEEAAYAYNEAAKRYYGEFARLNILHEQGDHA